MQPAMLPIAQVEPDSHRHLRLFSSLDEAVQATGVDRHQLRTQLWQRDSRPFLLDDTWFCLERSSEDCYAHRAANSQNKDDPPMVQLDGLADDIAVTIQADALCETGYHQLQHVAISFELMPLLLNPFRRLMEAIRNHHHIETLRLEGFNRRESRERYAEYYGIDKDEEDPPWRPPSCFVLGTLPCQGGARP